MALAPASSSSPPTGPSPAAPCRTTDREYSTFEFRTRVEAAARAGFKGVGLWHADLEHVLTRYTLPEMRQILDDNGMQYVEIEFLIDWFHRARRRGARNRMRAPQLLLEAAEGLGGRHIKVGRLLSLAGARCRS